MFVGNLIFKRARAHLFAHDQMVSCMENDRIYISSWFIDGILTGTTTLAQRNSNEMILHIPQSSKNKTKPSDGLMYPEHILKESYPCAEMQSAYSTAPTDRTNISFVTNLNSLYAKVITEYVW